MKRVCAWCGKDLDLAESGDGLPVTHGLCVECRRRHFPPLPAPGPDPPALPKGETADAGDTSGEDAP
jgi:hypothetical protein